MKTEYLYMFGYWTPEDQEVNDRGYDQESTRYFRVLAGSEEEALRWGYELSRWYTSHLFGNDGEPHWDSKWFASWIEYEPSALVIDAASAVPVVAPGEYPAIDDLHAAFRD